MYLQRTVLTVLIAFSISMALGQAIAPLPLSKNGFVVIAHRGSHLVKPENSLAAIEDAIRVGADYVELDLRTTKDGHLVLCHNQTVDATTNGKGSISDLTWSTLKQLQLVSKEGKEYHMPDFAEVLKLCRGHINIYLDFKEADVAETYRQVQEAGMEKHIVVYLNKVEQYAAWRKVAPAMPLMSSLPASVKTKDDLLALLEKMHLEVLDNAKDSSLLAATRANGINVWLDVQGLDENPAKWSAAMRMGIQGVQTDHPEALVKYLEQNKLRNGATVLPVTYAANVIDKRP
jgi:glycerophosphoryl diester phosphodiesterase